MRAHFAVPGLGAAMKIAPIAQVTQSLGEFTFLYLNICNLYRVYSSN